MNVEELDGFFAALITGPDTVMPSEYNREVFGGEMSEACEFGSLNEAKEILGLMMRHWNTIAGALLKGGCLRASSHAGRKRRCPWQRLGAWIHARDAGAARRPLPRSAVRLRVPTVDGF